MRAAPSSFKTHQGLADALYEANRDKQNLSRVIAELDLSVRILEPVPDVVNVPMVFRRAAGYYLEHGDSLRDSSGGHCDLADNTQPTNVPSR